MKFLRRSLLVALALLVVLGGVVAVAFSPWFQTWAARRAIAKQPGIAVTLGRVAAGLGGIELRDVQIERDGAVLTLPSARADFPIIPAVLSEKIALSRLVAQGWTLDLTHWRPADPARKLSQTEREDRGRSATFPGLISTARAAVAASPAPPPAGAPGFHGVFSQLQLPIDFSLDGLDLAGNVIFPDSRGRVRLALKGGGLGSGREGRFELSGDAALAEQPVDAIAVSGHATVAMDSPRTFSRLTATLKTSASGDRFPEGVTLTADLAARHEPGGEEYTVGVRGPERPLLTLDATFPRAAQRLTGAWKVDVRVADLEPFALGMTLPVFSAEGGGQFETDASFREIHTSGRIDTIVADLEVIEPTLAALGTVQLVTDFDVVRQGGRFAVKRLTADVSGERPVTKLRTLQAFEFNPATGDLTPENPDGEVLDIVLLGLPLPWLNPYLHGVVLAGEDLRGEFVALPRAGGIGVQSRTPLTGAHLDVAQDGKPLLAGIDFTLAASADYTPHGWQAELADLNVAQEGRTLLRLQARAGQLAGAAQPVKATGRLDASLPGLLAQPIGADALGLTAGDASLEFIANLGARQEFQGTIAFSKLAADPSLGAGELPAISADLRADVAPEGQITLHAPLLIERGGRKSDLTIAGTVTAGATVRTIVGTLTSAHLVLDDAKVLAAVLPGEPATPEPEGKPGAPVWSGYAGSLALDLKRVIYSETFQLNDVSGTLQLEEGALKVVGLRAGVGEGGRARVDGTVSFVPGTIEPYGLVGEMAVTDFNPGPLLQALMPGQPPTVEGQFNLSSQLTGRGTSIASLAIGTGGRIAVNSRGGIFRGLPVNVGNMVETTSRLAGWLASPLAALGALTGRKDYTEIASKTQAVAEFARGLNPIPYDQLNLELTRDAQLTARLENFSLISPELRLTGAGQVRRSSSASLLEDPLAMEFTLKARGRQGELLRFLGAIETETDDLGYAACTVPVTISGTLGSPDASEFSNRVAALALERSGLGDKASELLNRIRGGK